MEKYFSRKFHLTSNNANLEFLQYTVGDVGCVVWDAALVMAGFLDHVNKTEKKSLENLKILELGSGTGCVGLVAAGLGADCLLTDLPEMVPLIKKNVSHNAPNLKGITSVKAFEWGSDISNLTTFCSEFASGFDVVLAADCIYYKESLNGLIKTLEDLSPHVEKKTEIYISYEERESEEKEELVLEFMEKVKKTFLVSKICFEDYREDFKCEDIHIYKLVSL